jgi:hypothetical protein
LVEQWSEEPCVPSSILGLGTEQVLNELLHAAMRGSVAVT